MLIKNYMEELVFYTIRELSKKMDMCKCEKCILDIAALALNELPPKYFVTEKGEVFSKIDTLKQQLEIDITSSVTKAIEKVSSNPKH